MRKEDWIKVIENTFNTVDLDNGNGHFETRDDGIKTAIKIPLESKVYNINKDLEEIQILTKNYSDIEGFTGSHIVISKNLETCMLIDVVSVNHIPWDEITTIRVVFHPEM